MKILRRNNPNTAPTQNATQMNRTKIFFIILPLLLSLFQCSGDGNSDESPQFQQSQTSVQQESNDFDSFYEQFHVDTAYQMSHIIFPLEGLPANAGASDEDFHWEKLNWRPHVKFDSVTTGFSSEFTLLGDIVIEQIVHKSGQYAMIRRFAKLTDGEWYLIYYMDVNAVS